MVLPVIAAGVLAASAISQYLSSEEGRRASAKERRKLEAMLAKVESPYFDPKTLTPEEYKLVGTYAPQAAPYIAEQAPELVKMGSADVKAAREAQREALARLRGQAQGQDPLAQAELNQALAQAARDNRGRRAAITESFERRGQGGGTAEMLAQLLGVQQTNEQAADGSRAAFIEAQRRKLQALRDSSSLAGAIRDDEYRQERGNADVINSFNARTAQRRQAHADRSVDIANDGQKYNLNQAQRVSDNNVTTRNDFRVNERNRQDRMAQQVFDNDMSKVRAYAGVAEMGRSDAIGAARDRNSAISGASDAAVTTLGYYEDKKNEEEAEKRRSASDSLSAQPRYTSEAWEGENRDPLRRRYRLDG